MGEDCEGGRGEAERNCFLVSDLRMGIEIYITSNGKKLRIQVGVMRMGSEMDCGMGMGLLLVGVQFRTGFVERMLLVMSKHFQQHRVSLEVVDEGG